MGTLDGRVAIVTGAAQGIGATYAKALAAEGVKVMVTDLLDPAPVVVAITQHGGTAIGRIADATKMKDNEAMVADTVKAFGRLDILVTNAAIFSALGRGSFMNLTNADWDRILAANVKGPFLSVKAAVPEMRRQKYGKIVNISSGTVFMGVPGLLHYVTSKGGVDAFTRALAREVGDDGIRVNAIAPGLTMSEGVEAKRDQLKFNIEMNVKARVFKRDQMPDDLVGALLFLCGPESDFLTGQTLVVDGGAHMH
jgi:NAD(P)-dependent dehydrogenase (short-subunit alcohol dehydrogenase family)